MVLPLKAPPRPKGRPQMAWDSFVQLAQRRFCQLGEASIEKAVWLFRLKQFMYVVVAALPRSFKRFRKWLKCSIGDPY